VDSQRCVKTSTHLRGKTVKKLCGRDLMSFSSTLSTISSTTPTSSTSAPSNTGPGTYYIINVASNTAMDLLYGNPANNTQINGW